MEDQAEQIVEGDNQTQQVEGQHAEGASAPDANTAADDSEVSIVIEGESPTPEDETPKDAPAWVKQVREQQRKTAQENHALRKQLAELQKPQQAAEVGPKPTLQSCDYDDERFEQELVAWQQRKAEADTAAAEQVKTQQAQQVAWEGKVTRYAQQRKDLKVSDYAEAESIVEQTLSQHQAAIIVHGAENAAHLAYALAKNPGKLQELATIKDPIEFAFAVARLETKLKVQPRKTPPPPEDAVKGSSPVAGSADKHLEQLEAEADRTGDRSKIVAYKRKLKEQAA